MKIDSIIISDIIDFGDAKIIENKNLASPFVKDFINGLNQWNPEFK